MIRVTINNYQYWYNSTTKKLYLDEQGTNEVPLRSFDAQEITQFYNEIRLNSNKYLIE